MGPDLAAKIDSFSGDVTDYISGNYKKACFLKADLLVKFIILYPCYDQPHVVTMIVFLLQLKMFVPVVRNHCLICFHKSLNSNLPRTR